MSEAADVMTKSDMDWDRVRAHLAQHGMVLRPGTPPRFPGGLANQNYRIELASGPAVLRRPPPGPLPPGAHDMAREHRILARVPDALPFVPRSLHLCEDLDVIGVKFQILEYRDGIVVRDTVPPELADKTGALSEMLLRTLAAIHALDPDALGLGTLGRPEGFLARTVEGWVRRGSAMDGGPLLEELGGWLRANTVPDRAPTLLHNDFKLDNIILDPATLEPTAVVDWDQGTLGDPLFDLATLLSYWTEPGDPAAMQDLKQMPTAAPGFITREQAALRWSELTGRDVSDFRFHRVLGILKLAVIFLQLHGLYLRGATTDPRYIAFGPLAQGLLEFGHEVAAGRIF